MLVMILEELC